MDETLRTDAHRAVMRKVYEHFFAQKGIGEYLDFLVTRSRVARDELFVHLRVLHFAALHSVFAIHEKEGLFPKPNAPPPDISSSIQMFLTKWKEMVTNTAADADVLSIFFSQQHDIFRSLDLRATFANEPETATHATFWDFPGRYIEGLDRLTYPEAYVACFMKEATNAAVWGHYGDSHKGVCLKFRTSDSNPSIELNGIVGMGSKPIHKYRPYLFRAIQYSNSFPCIDFFRSLGRLPIGPMLSQWYTDHDGNRSTHADHIGDETKRAAWRDDYWKKYEASFFIKLKDWEYEKEHRLVLYDILDFHEKPEDRKLTYRFNDLEAIVFGTRTSSEDKLSIIKIVEAKCKENSRDSFDFYQANYSTAAGEMHLSKLAL